MRVSGATVEIVSKRKLLLTKTISTNVTYPSMQFLLYYAMQFITLHKNKIPTWKSIAKFLELKLELDQYINTNFLSSEYFLQITLVKYILHRIRKEEEQIKWHKCPLV